MSNIVSINKRPVAPKENLSIRDYTGYVGTIYSVIWSIGGRLYGMRDRDFSWARAKISIEVCQEELANMLVHVQDGMNRLIEDAKKIPGASDPRSLSFNVAVEFACGLVGTLQRFVDDCTEDQEDFDVELGSLAFEFHSADPAWPVLMKLQEQGAK